MVCKGPVAHWCPCEPLFGLDERLVIAAAARTDSAKELCVGCVAHWCPRECIYGLDEVL